MQIIPRCSAFANVGLVERRVRRQRLRTAVPIWLPSQCPSEKTRQTGDPGPRQVIARRTYEYFLFSFRSFVDLLAVNCTLREVRGDKRGVTRGTYQSMATDAYVPHHTTACAHYNTCNIFIVFFIRRTPSNVICRQSSVQKVDASPDDKYPLMNTVFSSFRLSFCSRHSIY